MNDARPAPFPAALGMNADESASDGARLFARMTHSQCGFMYWISVQRFAKAMSELYYAEMEAARNEAEDAYFKARPQLIRSFAEQALFRAGFERAFRLLWNPSGEAGRRAGVGPGGRAGQDCAGETRPAELGSTLETEPAPLCGNCGRDGCDYCDPR